MGFSVQNKLYFILKFIKNKYYQTKPLTQKQNFKQKSHELMCQHLSSDLRICSNNSISFHFNIYAKAITNETEKKQYIFFRNTIMKYKTFTSFT